MEQMLRFDDVILARPVKIRGEVKDREALAAACKKLDVLPIYYGVQHKETDEHGSIDHAIGRARHLKYDRDRDVVVGDVELDVLPEEFTKLGKIGYSTWYHTLEQDGGLLKKIMWKHIQATDTPLDEELETLLNMGYMVGESKELPVTPPVTPSNTETITVKQPSKDSDNMPDEKPKDDKKAEAEIQPSKVESPPQAPPPPPTDYTEARKELIQEYRDKLKGKLPDAAIKSLTLKSLRETWKEVKASEDAAKEPEHLPQAREGLPGSPAANEPSLHVTQGGYVTLEGDSFVESLSKTFAKANPNQSPYPVLTGPVSSYSNITSVDAAERKRLANEHKQ